MSQATLEEGVKFSSVRITEENFVLTHVCRGEGLMEVIINRDQFDRPIEPYPAYFNRSGMHKKVNALQPAIPIAEATAGCPELVRANWKATHTISEREVMQVLPPDGSAIGCTWWTKEGYRAYPTRLHKAVKIPVRQQFAKPMRDYQDGHKVGFKEGYEKALAELGVSEAQRERITAEFAVVDHKHPLRNFNTRDIASALFSILGAHDGQAWMIDGNLCEGQYLGRDEDGGYYVMARIFDWKLKGHHLFKLRVPPTMWMEVVEE